VYSVYFVVILVFNIQLKMLISISA